MPMALSSASRTFARIELLRGRWLRRRGCVRLRVDHHVAEEALEYAAHGQLQYSCSTGLLRSPEQERRSRPRRGASSPAPSTRAAASPGRRRSLPRTTSPASCWLRTPKGRTTNRQSAPDDEIDRDDADRWASAQTRWTKTVTLGFLPQKAPTSPRTARCSAASSTSGSLRRLGGMLLSVPATVRRIEVVERLLVLLDLGQALERRARGRTTTCPRPSTTRLTTMWPPNDQPPPAFDAALLGRAEDVAVEIELAGAHLAGKDHRIGEEADHVAVAGGEDGRDAVLPCRAWRAPRDARLRRGPAPAPAASAGRRGACSSSRRGWPVVWTSPSRLGDDLDAAVDQHVLDVDDFALVAGDGPGREDHAVAGVEIDRRMLARARCGRSRRAARPGCRCRAGTTLLRGRFLYAS